MFANIRTPTCRAVTRRTSAIEAHPAQAFSSNSRARCERRCSNRSRGPAASTRRRGSKYSSPLFVKSSDRAARYSNPGGSLERLSQPCRVQRPGANAPEPGSTPRANRIVRPATGYAIESPAHISRRPHALRCGCRPRKYVASLAWFRRLRSRPLAHTPRSLPCRAGMDI
jgi:hypothetical protein